MNLFGGLRKAAAESHGRLLWTILQDTILKMSSLSDQVRAAAIVGFIDKRGKLQHKLDNMSVQGRIRMGKFLQSEARKHFDTNMSEGYALWLAGAWLESMQRQGEHAAMVHHYLEGLAQEMEPLLDSD